MKLRKPTEVLRRTLDQQLKSVLGPEGGVTSDTGTYRKVIVLVPHDPTVFMALDYPGPREAGPNRTYDLPIAHPDQQIAIFLQPEQCLFMASKEAYAVVTLIVHYLEDGE